MPVFATPIAGTTFVSGRCQYPWRTSPSYAAGMWLAQSCFPIRCACSGFQLLLVNDTDADLSFEVAAKKNFFTSGTTVEPWTRLTAAGYMDEDDEVLTIPARSSVLTDRLEWTFVAGNHVFVRTFHDLADATTFHNNWASATYNGSEAGWNSIPAGASGYRLGEGIVSVASNRLLEGGYTFEINDLSAAGPAGFNKQYWHPFGVVSTPTTDRRLTIFCGDSKTYQQLQDSLGDQTTTYPWPNFGMGFGQGEPYINLALPSETAANFLAHLQAGNVRARFVLDWPADLHYAYAANDLAGASGTVATLIANLLACSALRHAGSRVYGSPASPLTKITSGAWTDAREYNQANRDGTVSITNVQSFNSQVTANPAIVGWQGLIAATTVTESKAGSAMWGHNSLTGDGVHEALEGHKARGLAFSVLWPKRDETRRPHGTSSIGIGL